MRAAHRGGIAALDERHKAHAGVAQNRSDYVSSKVKPFSDFFSESLSAG